MIHDSDSVSAYVNAQTVTERLRQHEISLCEYLGTSPEVYQRDESQREGSLYFMALAVFICGPSGWKNLLPSFVTRLAAVSRVYGREV